MKPMIKEFEELIDICLILIGACFIVGALGWMAGVGAGLIAFALLRWER